MAVSVTALTRPHKFPSIVCSLATIAMTARTQGILGTTDLGKPAPNTQPTRAGRNNPGFHLRPSTVDRSSPQGCPPPGRRAVARAEPRTAGLSTAASFSGKGSFVLRAPLYFRSMHAEGGPTGLSTLGVRVRAEQLRRKARRQWHAAAFSRGAQSARERAAFWEVWFYGATREAQVTCC